MRERSHPRSCDKSCDMHGSFMMYLLVQTDVYLFIVYQRLAICHMKDQFKFQIGQQLCLNKMLAIVGNVQAYCCTVNLEIFVYENFCNKNFCVKNFQSLTPLRNYLYKEIFLTKEELHVVHASLICLTTAEEYGHQSKVARSRLPHEAGNQYGEGTCIPYIGKFTRC